MAKEKSSFFEKLEAEVVKEAGDYVKQKVKKKAIRIGEVSLSFLFAFVLIIIGLAQMLASFVPFLENGLNYLLLGVLFLLIGMMLK